MNSGIISNRQFAMKSGVKKDTLDIEHMVIKSSFDVDLKKEGTDDFAWLSFAGELGQF